MQSKFQLPHHPPITQRSERCLSNDRKRRHDNLSDEPVTTIK